MTPNCKNLRRWIAPIFALTLLLAVAFADQGIAAQTVNTPAPMNPQPNTQPRFPGQPDPFGVNSESGIPPRMAAAAARARENERQKRLVSDSDKLLELATQLHAEVARTDKNILSVDVIHRADEIEKLAHSVKERMKGQQ